MDESGKELPSIPSRDAAAIVGRRMDGRTKEDPLALAAGAKCILEATPGRPPMDQCTCAQLSFVNSAVVVALRCTAPQSRSVLTVDGMIRDVAVRASVGRFGGSTSPKEYDVTVAFAAVMSTSEFSLRRLVSGDTWTTAYEVVG